MDVELGDAIRLGDEIVLLAERSEVYGGRSSVSAFLLGQNCQRERFHRSLAPPAQIYSPPHGDHEGKLVRVVLP
jgi:hypothetical protein